MQNEPESDSALPVKKRGNPAWFKGMRPMNLGRTGRRSDASKMEAVWQDPGPRAKILFQKHGVATVLRAAEDPKFAAKNFSSYDQVIIVAIANAMKGNGEERERLFNRIFGKVPDKQINLNVNMEITADALAERAAEMLQRLGVADNELVLD